MMRTRLSRSDVSVTTTDRASSIVNACSQMQLEHQRCFAHSLNRCVMYRLRLPGAENAHPAYWSLGGKVQAIGHICDFEHEDTQAFGGGWQATIQTFTTLKRGVATRWNSSYAVLESILKNQKILQLVFLDESFEENMQSLLPKVSQFHSIRLPCSPLAPFADATNLLEGETYITASLGLAVARQLGSELLADGLEMWRNGSAGEKLR